MCWPSSARSRRWRPLQLDGSWRFRQAPRMWTRTRKRGDRRRRCARGRSRAVVGMAANPSGAHQAGRQKAGRTVAACAVSGIAAQAAPNPDLRQERSALSDIKNSPRDPNEFAGTEEREEFIRLLDLLNEEGRERLLLLARHYLQQSGLPGAAAAPARTSRRGRGRGPDCLPRK